MALTFGIAFHITSAVFILILSYVTFRLAFGGHHETEKAVRIIALVAGFLFYGGVKALGISWLDLASAAISYSLLGTGAAILVPLFAGTFLARLMLIISHASNKVYARLTLMLLGFAITSLIDLWWEGLIRVNKSGNNVLLLPLVSFVIGFCVFVIVGYDPGSEAERGRDALRNSGVPHNPAVERTETANSTVPPLT